MHRDQIASTIAQLSALPSALEPSYAKHIRYYESNAIQYYKNMLYQASDWAGVGTFPIETVTWSAYHTNKYRVYVKHEATAQMRNITDTHWCEDVYWAPAVIIHRTQPRDAEAHAEYQTAVNEWLRSQHMSITKPWYMSALAGCWIAHQDRDRDKFRELFQRFVGFNLKAVKF